MQEVFFRKGRVTFTAISIFLLSLGYLLMIPLLLEKQPRHVDGLLYFVLAVVYFGALVLLLLNWIYLRLFWKCVIRHQPALVLADDGLVFWRRLLRSVLAADRGLRALYLQGPYHLLHRREGLRGLSSASI